MSNASFHQIQKYLDHLTGNAPWTAPTGLWLALCKTSPAPSDSLGGAWAKEVEASATNGYARQSLSMALQGSQISISDGLLTFGPSTTGWSEVVGAWVVDSATVGAGDIWLGGDLVTPKTAGAGDSILFAIGEVIFAMV